MKLVVFLLFFCFSKNCISQLQNTKEYNNYINKAELDLIDSNYESAMLNYDSAFKDYKKIFAKDFYNAFVCAVKALK